MGVTLERVQNKFACIVGELTNDPDILSEFAIWLDMRLAEYKANGSIILEFSGEAPNPDWLRGHKRPGTLVKPTETLPDQPQQHHIDTGLNCRQHLCSPQLQNLQVGIGSTAEAEDVLAVKEEPVSDIDIEPIFTHTCVEEDSETGRHTSNTSDNQFGRKRLPYGCDMDKEDPETPEKIQRLSASSIVLEPVSQSLLSIIGDGDAEESAEISTDVKFVSNFDVSSLQTDDATPATIPSPSDDAYPVDPVHCSHMITAKSSNQDCRRARPKPGVYPQDFAKKHKMVSLFDGFSVFLHQDQLAQAIRKCLAPSRRSKSRPSGVGRPDSSPAARYLLGLFFTDEELVSSSLHSGRDHSEGQTTSRYRKLNPEVVDAIIAFCVTQAPTKVSTIRRALTCKITGARSRKRMRGVLSELNNSTCNNEPTLEHSGT